MKLSRNYLNKPHRIHGGEYPKGGDIPRVFALPPWGGDIPRNVAPF